MPVVNGGARCLTGSLARPARAAAARAGSDSRIDEDGAASFHVDGKSVSVDGAYSRIPRPPIFRQLIVSVLGCHAFPAHDHN
jgi:hypothetical protein